MLLRDNLNDEVVVKYRMTDESKPTEVVGWGYPGN